MDKASESLWKLISVKVVKVDDDTNVVAISLSSNGNEYVIAVSGAKDMGPNNVINALRAGIIHFVRVHGYEIQVEGARDATKAETEALKRELN
jgi:hypothetical protein